MRSLRSVRLAVIGLAWSVGLLAAAEETPRGPVPKPKDRVTVTHGPTPIMVGEDQVGTAQKGDEFLCAEVQGEWVGVAFERDGKKATGWIPMNCVASVRSEGPPRGQGATNAVSALRFMCSFRVPVVQRGAGLTPLEARKMAANALGKCDYLLYVEGQGEQGATLVAFRGTKLPAAEVRGMAAQLSECRVNGVASSELGAFVFFGGAKTAGLPVESVLLKALRATWGANLPDGVHLRFDPRTAQAVVSRSFDLDEVLDPRTIRLHPDHEAAAQVQPVEALPDPAAKPAPPGEGVKPPFVIPPSKMDKKALLVLHPLLVDKEKRANMTVTLALKDGKLNGYCTGFAAQADLETPKTGWVSFVAGGIAAQSSFRVTVNGRRVWEYDGDQKDSVESGPVALNHQEREAKTLHISLTVGLGTFPRGGIQWFEVYEEPPAAKAK